MRQNKDEARTGIGQPRGYAACRGIWALVLPCLLWTALSAQPRPGDPARKSAEAGGAAPLLLVTQTEIDLGELPQGSSAEARFELRNAGSADLRILDVASGCACTIATYDEVIPPGGVGYVTATLLTETLNGSVGQGVSLMTNDPTSPATYLLVRAEIVVAVRILPERPIVLMNQPGNLPVRRVIRRSTGSGHGFFNIVGLRASAPWIDARARKVREAAPAADGLPAVDSGDWILEVGLQGQPVYGKSRGEIEFKTGLERQPEVRLEVHADLVAPVQLPVERLFLQVREAGAVETFSFNVREGLDPSGLRVDASPDGLSVRLEPGEGQTMTAHVRWSGGRLEDGRLEFRLADERLELPVIFQTSR